MKRHPKYGNHSKNSRRGYKPVPICKLCSHRRCWDNEPIPKDKKGGARSHKYYTKSHFQLSMHNYTVYD